jgi:hypothetical protein
MSKSFLPSAQSYFDSVYKDPRIEFDYRIQKKLNEKPETIPAVQSNLAKPNMLHIRGPYTITLCKLAQTDVNCYPKNIAISDMKKETTCPDCWAMFEKCQSMF